MNKETKKKHGKFHSREMLPTLFVGLARGRDLTTVNSRCNQSSNIDLLVYLINISVSAKLYERFVFCGQSAF